MACTRLLLFTCLKPKLFVYSEKPYKLSLVYRKLTQEINDGYMFGTSDVLITEQHISWVTREDGLKVLNRLNNGECFKCGHILKCEKI